ncbi:hypothetical protein RRG08_034484 [Elysia crispata]|uniref:FAM234A/B beta-propeller domain-containing protein n=1 Tax=Elysia crispata TaxID=231223 RepID=A0AAE1DH14_9GAST|nr:hypothetical protein RRG08_034484 [Elysia crispata]
MRDYKEYPLRQHLLPWKRDRSVLVGKSQQLFDARSSFVRRERWTESGSWRTGNEEVAQVDKDREIKRELVTSTLLTSSEGADGFGVKNIVCDIYFEGKRPCFGGVLALEGATGKELWRVYAQHEVYGLNCQYDLDTDGVKDCLAAGRAGTFFAVSCKQGKLLWTFGESEALNPVMNFYTPQYVRDLDGDDVADLVTVHGGDPLQEAGSPQRLSGRVLLVSGRTGHVIRWVGVPDNRESYYSPQITTHLDQVPVLLFGTGGETHNGSLWELEVESLVEGLMDRAVKLSSDTHKGFMTPPALVDVTGDGVEDILVPVFNSTLLALDGGGGGGGRGGHRPLWTARFPGSETYSTPAVGHYNDDDIPDLLVKYAHGPGYPVYYYSETTVIDGKTGHRLVDPPLRDTVGSQASPLTVAMEGPGNDVFLTWMADCAGHEGDDTEFAFVKGTDDHEKSRSDLCRLRYKTDGVSKMIALSRHLPPAGIPIYQSKDRKTVEHSKWVNTSAEAYEYIIKHPSLLEGLTSASSDNDWDNEDDQPAAEYPSVPRERYRPSQYSSAHSIGSKKGPPSSARTNNRMREYPSRQGLASHTGGRSSAPQYTQGNNRENSNRRYGARNNGRYFSPSSAILPADDLFGIPSSSSSSSSYQGNRNRANSNGFYEAPYESMYPNSNNRGDGYNRGYPYKYGRSVSPRKRGSKGSNRGERRPDLEGKERRRDRKGDELAARIMRKRRKRHARRHVGPHDDGGLQRLLSTGHLAPPSLPADHPDYNSSMDLVFATYWFFPVRTQAILPADRKCIAEKLTMEGDVRFDPESQFYQMDHAQYEQAVTELCLRTSDHELPDDRIYSNSDDDYNPFDVNMGQMTVYRLRLKFSCSQPINASDTNTKCASVLPFAQQKWAGYMGSNGDSHWMVPDL